MPPIFGAGGAGQKRSGPDDIYHPRWRGQEWKKEAHDGGLDLVASPSQQLARTIILQPFKGGSTGAIDELVGGLNKVFLQFLQLDFLLRPIPGARRGVDGMHIFMIFNERLDGLWGQLEGDLVLGDHVDVDDVCFDIQDLVVEQRLHERVGVFAEFGVWRLGEHDGTQGPDGRRAGKDFGQASKVLRDAIQRPLHSIDPLQCRRQPWIYLGIQDDIRSGARCKGGRRGGQEGDRHRKVVWRKGGIRS